MQHLYFTRHGQSQANADHVIAGSHESPLSDLGRHQARFAGETAKKFFHFDLIVSSPMNRALETAELIAAQLGYPNGNILVLDDLRERNLGDVEGTTYNSMPGVDNNYEDAENVPGVEPIASLFERVSAVYHTLQNRPERQVLVVGHNGCGRMLKVVVRGLGPMAMYEQARTENAIFYKLI